MEIITSQVFTCASVMTKGISGIGMEKNIRAPVMETPSLAGLVSTCRMMAASMGRTIMAISRPSTRRNFRC